MLEVQGVRVDPSARRVWRDEVEIPLSRKEFQLLHALIARSGEVVTRAELMADVWGATFYTTTKTIDVHLGWLRRKLGDDPRQPRLIRTVRGRGLCFLDGADEVRRSGVDGVAAFAPDTAVADGAVDGSFSGSLNGRGNGTGLDGAV